MDYLIAPTLFHNKICRLPGLGKLVLVDQPAETDFVNTQINSPKQFISFEASFEQDNTFNEFSALSELMLRNLDDNGSVVLNGIGTFIKNDAGIISFEPITIDPIFTAPVNAERVIRQDSEHAILVGDKETTNTVMTEFYSDEEVSADRWWIWAVILGFIGIAAIVFYLSQHNWHFGTLGNGHPIL